MYKKEVVCITKIESSKEKAVEKALKLIKAEKIFKDKKNILIKPNLVRVSYPGSGIITDYRVVSGIINFLKTRGVNKMIIGESSGKITKNTLEAYKAGGYTKLKVPLIDFNKDSFKEIKLEDIKIRLAKKAIYSDCIINVPVIKCHHRARVSISMKNLMGCIVGGKYKAMMHKEYKKDSMPLGEFLNFESKFAKRIVELNKNIKTNLIVVDGGVGREIERDGPKVKLNLIISGTNPVSVDAVCCRIIGINPYKVAYLKLAEENGLGPISKNKIRILGEDINLVKKDFKEKKFWRDIRK